MLFGIPHLSNAERAEPESSAIYEELKGEHADWLRKNFIGTDFTAHIKIKTVSVHKEIPPYIVLSFQADVLEVFKGEQRREITYLRMVEGPITQSDLKLWAGSTPIVSLYQEKISASFEMGDNGYDLPDTPHLLSVARSLAKKAKRDSPKRANQKGQAQNSSSN
jgi:hypothetical protein